MLFSAKYVRSWVGTSLLLLASTTGVVGQATAKLNFRCCDTLEQCLLTPFYPDDTLPFINDFCADYFQHEDLMNLPAICDDKEHTTLCRHPNSTLMDSISTDYQCCDNCEEQIGCFAEYVEDIPILELGNLCNVDETCYICSAALGCMDPHFKTWGGEWYDFHGVCDLVMLDVPDFNFGQGLTIHIRTKGRYEYSYIESAAIQIGDDVFQLNSYGDYFLNGVSHAELPNTIAGYKITLVSMNKKESKFEIQMNDQKSIEMSTFKDMVNVKTSIFDPRALRTSKGLFGSFPNGDMVGRDGKTIFTDADEFGQEWQTLDTDPKLFAVADRFPQHPHNKCTLPDPTKTARRLGEGIASEAAEEACSHWGELKEMCIKDVIATGDIEVAEMHHHIM